MSNTKRLHDPDLYDRMSVPRSDEEAAAAYAAFFEEVCALREKYRIRDLVVIVTLAVETKEGKAARLQVGHRGDTSKTTAIVAHALGILRRDDDAHLDALAGGKEPG